MTRVGARDKERRWRGPAAGAATLGAVLVAAGGVAACFRDVAERALFYYPSREPFPTPPGVEDVCFTTADGVRLHGWLMRPPGVAAGVRVPAVLHVHGNAGNVSWHAGFSDFLPAHGYAVLLFDYRGFGRSEAGRRRPGRDELLEDTRAAWRYLTTRADVDAGRVGVYGVSLGAVVGLALAAEQPRVRAVVALSPFATWRGIARDHGGVLGWWLVRPGMDAVESVGRLGDRPVLLVHGRDDEIVPVGHARQIAEAATRAGVPVQTLIIPGLGHNDFGEARQTAHRSIVRFLDSALGQDEAAGTGGG